MTSGYYPSNLSLTAAPSYVTPSIPKVEITTSSNGDIPLSWQLPSTKGSSLHTRCLQDILDTIMEQLTPFGKDQFMTLQPGQVWLGSDANQLPLQDLQVVRVVHDWRSPNHPSIWRHNGRLRTTQLPAPIWDKLRKWRREWERQYMDRFFSPHHTP